MLFLTDTNLETSQYAITLLISLYEQKLQKNQRLLPPCQMPSFQDPEIQEVSLSYFCSSVPATDGHHIERPSKRARLASVNDDQILNDMRSNVVSNIYSLLGLQVNAALSGLSQNAVYDITISIFV